LELLGNRSWEILYVHRLPCPPGLSAKKHDILRPGTEDLEEESAVPLAAIGLSTYKDRFSIVENTVKL
jgi:hypothetical protein